MRQQPLADQLEPDDECPNCQCGTLEESTCRKRLVCRGECGQFFPRHDVFVIQSHETMPDGAMVVTISLADGFESYKRLPQALSYDGRLYGKTGWNSDLMVCYYRDDAAMALES